MVLNDQGPMRSLNAAGRRLAGAATNLDTVLIDQMVRSSVDEIGVVATWEQLVQPVWQYLGSPPDAVGRPAAEHVYVQHAIRALSAPRRAPRLLPAAVLLACADNELQSFTLDALVAALQESGASCCALGARVPPDALAAAVTRLRPAVTVIWSQTRTTADASQITTVVEACPATTIVAAGPGWRATTLPPPIMRPTDLSTALVLILAALEGQA